MSKLQVLAKLGLDSADYEAGIQKIKGKHTDLTKNVQGTGSAISSVFGGISDQLGGTAGEIGKYFGVITQSMHLSTSTGNVFKEGFGGVVNSVKGSLSKMVTAFVSAFKAISAALLANPIGAIITAIVVAITALVTWLKRTDEGADVFARALNGIKAVINVVLDRLTLLGSAVHKLITGDFKGAWSDVKGVFTNVGDAIKENIDRANEYTTLIIEHKDLLVTYNYELAKLNTEASKYHKIVRDDQKPLAERMDALKKYREVQEKINKLKLEEINYQIKIKENENAQSISTRDDIRALNDLYAQRTNLQAELNESITQTFRDERRLNNELEAQTKEIEKQIDLNTKNRMKAVEEQGASVSVDYEGNLAEMDSVFAGLETSANEFYPTLLDYNLTLKNSFDGLVTGMQEAALGIGDVWNGLKDIGAGVFGEITKTLAAGAESFKSYGQAIKATLKQAASAMIGEAVIAIVSAQLKKYAWLNPALALGLATAAGGIAKTSLNMLLGQLGFASGGIVPGSNFYGDLVPAYLNSGEMVLNTTQQKNLFSMLNRGTSSNTLMGDVRFEIEGDKLVGVLSNYSKVNQRL